jgi:hypothetical protein
MTGVGLGDAGGPFTLSCYVCFAHIYIIFLAKSRVWRALKSRVCGLERKEARVMIGHMGSGRGRWVSTWQEGPVYIRSASCEGLGQADTDIHLTGAGGTALDVLIHPT